MKPKKFVFNIKRKLLAISALPTALLALILVFFYINNVYTSNVNSYNEQSLSLARAYSTAVEREVTNLAIQFDSVIKNDAVVDQISSMAVKKKLLASFAEISTFNDFSIAYEDGKTYNDTDISQREYFKKAKELKSHYVSSPVVRMTDNTTTIMMGKYFEKYGKSYVVYGGLNADFFNKMIGKIEFGEGGIAFIFDKDGIVVGTSTSMVPVLTDIDGENRLDSSFRDAAAKMLSSDSGNIGFSYNGKAYLGGFAQVDGNEGWKVAVATPSEPLISSIVVSCVIIVLVAAALVAGAVLLAGMIIKNIAGPISAASARLSEMAKGDLTSPAQTFRTGDEIEVMTSALTDMVRNMNTYISDIRETLTAVSNGDLTRPPKAQYSGDFTEIKNSMDMIVSSLNDILSGVSRSSAEVHRGAGQLAEGSSGLSSGAIAQAAAVDEVTATVTSMANKTSQNEQTVKNALEIVKSAERNAQNGTKSMKEMLDAINAIEASSKEIGKIIKVIEDIAFQTNILALNAAIEAARAGNAGRGFAVVADEVRNLAAKSDAAAKQTGGLITQSMAAVERGTALAKTTSQALGEIVGGVEQVSGSIDSIAKFNEEQNSAVIQISQAMESVNSAIHNTTATAQESAAESQELSTLAQNLSSSISHFRFSDTEQ